MKVYEFLDKSPAVGRLAIVEGEERVLAEIAVAALLDRLLPLEVRELNLDHVPAHEFTDGSRVREAAQAMPFLAERRVVLVTDAQTLRAQQRRDLLEAAQAVPEGNTMIVVDLVGPRSKRPEPLGALAGRSALRIDTTANEDVRERFVRETLASLGATADARTIDTLVRSESELASVRNDLEKLALSGKKIAFADLERETLASADPKAYKFASAIVEGRTALALGIAEELFFNEPRNAGMALLNALATEFGAVWEMAREGGELPARLKWREKVLRPIAARIGERRARAAYERALRGMEAIVTGNAGNDPDDHRALLERIGVELSGLAEARR